LVHNTAVLRVHAKFQSLLTVGVERKQVTKTIREAMQNTSPQIDGCINQRVRRSALFGLDVIGVPRDRHVGIVAEWHLVFVPA
jgi:hypothetical protein